MLSVRLIKTMVYLIYPPRSTVLFTNLNMLLTGQITLYLIYTVLLMILRLFFNQQTVNQQQSSVRKYKSVTNSTLLFYVHHKNKDKTINELNKFCKVY